MNKIFNKLAEDNRSFDWNYDGERESINIFIDDGKEIEIVKTTQGYDVFMPSDKPFVPPTQFKKVTEEEVLKLLGYE
ncbi:MULTISPECIES: hypothetical protein [Staphylococcus]|uniref:hypothetical protein n=1 Tax=Staphylococcus TaxID=1279 RepID=UPI001403BE60|nr:MULTISPECIES: hypothetical protein [Staphylococcus]NHM75398.1 hypothetical protein [Staphylococcus sp. 11007852]NHM91315.1 hypothetical protein [Staphylococcus sp. 10602379]NJH83281.1 hypothetical protein [Staphylococcus agnetis]